MIFFQSFLLVLNQFIPVFLVILTGMLLSRSRFFEPADFQGLEKITYHVILPAVVIMSLVKVDIKTLPFLSIGGALAGGILIVATLLFMLRTQLSTYLNINGAAFSSLFQGSLRWNSYTGLAICIALYGQRGLVVTSIAFLAMIPLLNVLCVIVIAKYARGENVKLQDTFKTLLFNPFIWSSLLGLILSILQLPIPQALLTYGNFLSSSAMAMGLLLVGAGLQLEALRISPPLAVASVLKLILMPLIVGALGYWFGVRGIDFQAMMVCACVPTASAAYILAKTLGGDAPFMAQIITIQTLLAIFTMPILLTLCTLI